MSTELSTDDPLVLYDELLVEGRAPSVEHFCARYPNSDSLAGRIRALLRLRADLRRLARPGEMSSPGEFSPPNGFTLLRRLGSGGMGIVFLAEQQAPRRLCALKLIYHATDDAKARFAREADLAARLAHPGIATVFEFGVEAECAYLASEYIRGFSLRTLLLAADTVAPDSGLAWIDEALRNVHEGVLVDGQPCSPAPVKTMTMLAAQIAEALAHAHERGVVHRDVKPSNVMIGFDGAAKLIDFGIAVSGNLDEGRVTRTGAFIGSYDYAAPEQLRGDCLDIGPWTDTYALGATLFEMLTLRTPFECPSFAERLALADECPPRGPRYYNPSVPLALDALVMRALDPAPSRRFADGREMAEALHGWSEHEVLMRFPTQRWSIRIGKRFRQQWIALLAAFAAAVATWLYVAEADRAREVTARYEGAQHRAAEEILSWRLEDKKEELQQCLPKVKKADPAMAIADAPPLPTRLWATVTVRRGRVTQVKPRGHFGLNARARDCLVEVISDLRLPGVGALAAERLIVDVRVAAPARLDIDLQGL